MSGVGWSLGGLSLVPDGAPGAFWFETLADGWDLGSPEAVKAVFASLAADGDDERVVRHGNREVTFQVVVSGADLGCVADGARALRLAMVGPTELRFTPPGGMAEVCVFDVLNATMRAVSDDLALVRDTPSATFSVVLTCKPFMRPVSPTVVSLAYSGTAPTVLNAATSTSGVTGKNAGNALTLSAVTYLGETSIKGTPSVARDLGWSDPFDEYVFANVNLTAAMPYFWADVAFDPGLGFRLDQPSVVARASSPGMVGAPVGFAALANGFRRYFFAHTLAGTTQTITLNVRMQQVAPSATSAASYIGNIGAASTAPATGMIVAEVGGTERAPLSLKIARTAAGTLLQTIVFSDPAMLAYGYDPSIQATWPNAPAGTYTAYVPGGGAAGNVYTLTINGQTSTTRATASGETLMFELDLGNRRDARLGAITLSATANGAPTSYATLYLFRNKPGETALVYLPSVGKRYLFVDSPTIERNEVGLWAGDVADGSDAVAVTSGALSADTLDITPPLFAIWAVASGSTAISATATYYPMSLPFVSLKVGA